MDTAAAPASATPAGLPSLRKYAWLSIAAALATIGLKSGAYLLTGSVGLLSDAAESLVNLIAAIVALFALIVASRPADAAHHYGPGKAEYFSAGIEGMMIFVAAAVILYSSVDRFLHPAPLENLGIGLAVSTVAAVLNGVVGMLLLRPGRAHRSATLVADGKHLLTDVWTSIGVIVGVLLVGLTGWERLDPVVAAAVGLNILITGWHLIAQSGKSLLDAALPEQDLAVVRGVLDTFRSPYVDFHGLQTRESGRDRFVAVHVLVPGEWTVQQGHDVVEQVEHAIREALPDTTVQTHLAPCEDERSYGDHTFDGSTGRS